MLTIDKEIVREAECEPRCHLTRVSSLNRQYYLVPELNLFFFSTLPTSVPLPLFRP